MLDIHGSTQKMRDTWRKLWFQMADGNLSEYDRIKGKDIIEFWHAFNMWRDKVTKDVSSHKHKQKNGRV